jgi:hypothetical protein
MKKKKPEIQIEAPDYGLHGLLIDPFKREVSMVTCRNNIKDWYRILQCDCLEVIRLLSGKNAPAMHDGSSLDLWVDEEFLLAERVTPAWRITYWDNDTCECRPIEIFGYGLLFLCDQEGETECLHLEMSDCAKFLTAMNLQFEHDTSPRLKKAGEFVEERMRNIELELPGKFKAIYEVCPVYSGPDSLETEVREPNK